MSYSRWVIICFTFQSNFLAMEAASGALNLSLWVLQTLAQMQRLRTILLSPLAMKTLSSPRLQIWDAQYKEESDERREEEPYSLLLVHFSLLILVFVCLVIAAFLIVEVIFQSLSRNCFGSGEAELAKRCNTSNAAAHFGTVCCIEPYLYCMW